ncbi:MAG: conjugative transfer signal peptidase TraF [Candidatus Thiodiazotropha sp. (ex Dulcina madagascariensis)]|nr:conjugative transfer signal peptidase TraF [Candidatus Thiodiazotropha sp. (ex Dulcina madagascariensis)]
MTRVIKYVTWAATVSLLLAVIAWSIGIRINTTVSIPLGVYITADEPVSTGSYVIFCPPDNAVFTEAKSRGYIGAGYCPGDYGYIMKKVLAAKNDVISVSDQGVIVNGHKVPLSMPLRADGANRSMPYFRTDDYALPDQQLLLMSDVTGLSFDARYFGPVNIGQISSVIHPVITW